MIELKNLTKVYGGKVKAVDNITLDIIPGEIFGFLGPNGAGKTTAIKMITGITEKDSGSIVVNGIDIDENPLGLKREFGFVSDSPDMFLRLKGLEYLNFMADIYDVEESLRKDRIRDLSKRFAMEDALLDRISGYSHGMRQKIIIMGALIHDPNVWILDEPMTGLDPKSSFYLKEMMREHADKNNIVFFSTHVLEVAEKICDRIGIINKGKLVFVGTMDELKKSAKENESLENIFLEMMQDDQ